MCQHTDSAFIGGGGIWWDIILFKLRKSMTNKVLPKMYVIYELRNLSHCTASHPPFQLQSNVYIYIQVILQYQSIQQSSKCPPRSKEEGWGVGGGGGRKPPFRWSKWPGCPPEGGMGDVLLNNGSVSLAMLEGKLVLRPRLFMCLTNMYIVLTVCCLKHPFKHFANIS